MVNKKKILCFDIDGIICKTKKNYYRNSKPIKKNIIQINNYYEKGYFIKIFTSRFMGRSKENVSNAKKKGYLFTQKQLKKWGIKYDKLIMGKPSYDVFIDDKAFNSFEDYFLKKNE